MRAHTCSQVSAHSSVARVSLACHIIDQLLHAVLLAFAVSHTKVHCCSLLHVLLRVGVCSFVVFGLLRPDYGLLLCLLGLTASAVGQLLINKLLRRFQRPSIITLLIGSVIVLSAVLMASESVVDMAESGFAPHKGGICA